MRINLFFILSFYFFFSCNTRKEVFPIEENKLIEVLADIHLAEAAFQNLSTSAKDTLAYQYYDQIYQIHEVNKDLVDSCIAILKRDPERFYNTYDKVQEFLVKATAENLKQHNKKTKKN